MGGWMAGWAAVAVCIGVLLAGCAEAVSDENYEAVTQGMTLDEVERILGAGEQQTSGGVDVSGAGVMSGSNDSSSSRQVYLWKAEGKQIIITFKDGKVASKNKTGF